MQLQVVAKLMGTKLVLIGGKNQKLPPCMWAESWSQHVGEMCVHACQCVRV